MPQEVITTALCNSVVIEVVIMFFIYLFDLFHRATKFYLDVLIVLIQKATKVKKLNRMSEK